MKIKASELKVGDKIIDNNSSQSDLVVSSVSDLTVCKKKVDDMLVVTCQVGCNPMHFVDWKLHKSQDVEIDSNIKTGLPS